jgi:hypothetical protein
MSKEQPAIPYIILNFSIWKLSNCHTVAVQHQMQGSRCDPMHSIQMTASAWILHPMAGKASPDEGTKKPAQRPA